MQARPIFLVLQNLAPGRTNIKASIDPMIPENTLAGSPAFLKLLLLTICAVRALVVTLAVNVAVAESNKNAVEGREQLACVGAPEQVRVSSPRNPLTEVT